MANRYEMGCPHWPKPCPTLDECRKCQEVFKACKYADLAPRITAAIELLEDNGYVVGLALDAHNNQIGKP